jgi:hypothetical protein
MKPMTECNSSKNVEDLKKKKWTRKDYVAIFWQFRQCLGNKDTCIQFGCLTYTVYLTENFLYTNLTPAIFSGGTSLTHLCESLCIVIKQSKDISDNGKLIWKTYSIMNNC